MDKKKIKYILLFLVGIGIAVLLIFFLNPFGWRKKEKEVEFLTPIGVDKNELMESYATVEDYYTAIGEDPNEMMHGDNPGLEYYEYRVLIRNLYILEELEMQDDCYLTLTQYLSAYLDSVLPGEDKYYGEIKEDSYKEIANGCMFSIYLPDYNNLKIRAYYDRSEHGFMFKSELDPEKEDTEKPDFKDYIMNEITDIVTEDYNDTKDDIPN